MDTPTVLHATDEGLRDQNMLLSVVIDSAHIYLRSTAFATRALAHSVEITLYLCCLQVKAA